MSAAVPDGTIFAKPSVLQALKESGPAAEAALDFDDTWEEVKCVFSPTKWIAPARFSMSAGVDWQTMGFLAPVKWFWRWFGSWVWALRDAVPPYHKVDGPLEAKETDPNGGCYICVGSAWVEVDKTTSDTLVVGENLRMRFTRGKRAINIDRILSAKGPG